MNNPIRRLATLCAIMFCALLIAVTYVQYVIAGDLRARPDNQRTLRASYSQPRGTILVEEEPVAVSKVVNDQFKRLRTYPKGKAFSHLTGYFSFVYGAQGGLEGAADGILTGRADELFYRRLGDLLTGNKPTGVDIETTLNTKAQQAAEKGLGNQRGAVVALNPKTGAILAMVSHPQYDPNELASHDLKATQAAYERLLKDPGKPLYNRAIAGDLYPPGSTFKVITAAAALSAGKSPDTQLPGPAVLPLPNTEVGLRNHGGDCGAPKVTMKQALKVSCNPAFGQLGMDLGEGVLREQSKRFGFDTDLSIPMNVAQSTMGAVADDAQLARAAIGQQSVRVTPLQMAMMAGGIANDGVVMRPHLIKQMRAANLEILNRTNPTELSRAVTPEVAGVLKDMLTDVVEHGTGTNARLSGVRVAGKTGTAEYGTATRNSPLRVHAWFVSFAPVNDPKVAVAVVVEDGGNAGSEALGGQVSAPIAREVMKAVINQ